MKPLERNDMKDPQDIGETAKKFVQGFMEKYELDATEKWNEYPGINKGMTPVMWAADLQNIAETLIAAHLTEKAYSRLKTDSLKQSAQASLRTVVQNTVELEATQNNMQKNFLTSMHKAVDEIQNSLPRTEIAGFRR